MWPYTFMVTFLKIHNCEVIKHCFWVVEVFRLLTDFFCFYTYEFWLSLWKIVRSSVILLLPLLTTKISKNFKNVKNFQKFLNFQKFQHFLKLLKFLLNLFEILWKFWIFLKFLKFWITIFEILWQFWFFFKCYEIFETFDNFRNLHYSS
jgi:hypothetical protein